MFRLVVFWAPRCGDVRLVKTSNTTHNARRITSWTQSGEFLWTDWFTRSVFSQCRAGPWPSVLDVFRLPDRRSRCEALEAPVQRRQSFGLDGSSLSSMHSCWDRHYWRMALADRLACPLLSDSEDRFVAPRARRVPSGIDMVGASSKLHRFSSVRCISAGIDVVSFL